MPRTLKLAVIGTAAGAFSGLLGVGGGSVIVPLLIVWLGYGEREATGTSMMAIVVIAALAVTLQAFYGNVDPPNAALVGSPGDRRGDRRHRRSSSACPERAISLLFAGLLVVIAVEADRPVSSVAAAIMGFAGGMVGGLLGVGGGILFVPALAIFLDETQVARRGDLAARDRPGRDRRRLAPARLRQRPGPRGPGDRRALAGRRRASGWSPPTRSPSAPWS